MRRNLLSWTGSQETCKNTYFQSHRASKSLPELSFAATVLEITARARFRGHCAEKSLLGLAYFSFGVTVLRLGLRNHCSTSLSEATECQNHCPSSLSKPLCSKSLLELAFEAIVLEITARTCLSFLRRHCAASNSNCVFGLTMLSSDLLIFPSE